MSILDMLDDLESRDKSVCRAPFAYPGGKSKSLKNILPHLPYKNTYVEPFGGSGAVLLGRRPSKLEIYNDRYGGVVAFYRCIADPVKYKELEDRCYATIHSREDFIFCKSTWDQPHLDDIERAYRWYYMMVSSFGSLGRNWARATRSKNQSAGKIRDRVNEFIDLHRRLKYVQIENLDWTLCIKDYDSTDTVYYLDPPYLETNTGTYKVTEFTHQDHVDLLEMVMDCKGYVAISSYENELYNSYNWDHIVQWDAYVSITSVGCVDNGKDTFDSRRGHRTETLYIKEAE